MPSKGKQKAVGAVGNEHPRKARYPITDEHHGRRERNMIRDALDQPRWKAELLEAQRRHAEHNAGAMQLQLHEKERLGRYKDGEREIKRLEEMSGGSFEALMIAQAERAAARRKAARLPRKGEAAQTVIDGTDGLKTA